MEKLQGKIVKLKDGLILVSVEDKAALLDVQNRCYYNPNDTAMFLLKLMEGGCLYEDMKTDLIDRFEVDVATTGLDLDEFIAGLNKMSLIEVGSEARYHQRLTRLKKDTYQSPLIERQAEILVGVAASAPPPDP